MQQIRRKKTVNVRKMHVSPLFEASFSKNKDNNVSLDLPRLKRAQIRKRRCSQRAVGVVAEPKEVSAPPL